VIAPYAYAGVGMANGMIDSKPTGSLTYTGFSGCVGPGASWNLGRSWKMSAEGVLSFGSASWRELPFANSTSRKFDPSIQGGLVHLSYVWGWQ
jgi:hypothetical protein